MKYVKRARSYKVNDQRSKHQRLISPQIYKIMAEIDVLFKQEKDREKGKDIINSNLQLV